MALIYIDNKAYDVKAGHNLLEISLGLGLNLPYFCWHPALGSVGACRQCAVKSFKDENDKQGRLVMGCMEEVRDGGRYAINDEFAVSFRAQVIEWLMTNHPHDCPVCDEGGSCHLQDMTVMTGHNYRRYQFKKRTYRNQYLGPLIHHEMNRCIQCYRCVRFYNDYSGGRDLNVFAAHNHVYFGRSSDGVLESPFSGNLSEVCPTGVFTDKTLKDHYTRKWDLTMAPSICQHCSVGCNIIAGERYGSLRVIQNRFNSEVNGYFICDRGRYGYEFVNNENRIDRPLIRNRLGEASNEQEVLDYLTLTFSSGEIIGIGSARASMESNFALRQLVGEDNFYQGISEDEAYLVRKVISIHQSGKVHCASLKEIETADAVLILGEDIWNTAPRMALSVIQAVKKTSSTDSSLQLKIPSWNDAAIKEFTQQHKGFLANVTVIGSPLDEVSTVSMRLAPDDIARMGFAIAHQLDPAQPAVNGLTNDEEKVASSIATALVKSKRPVIISGVSSYHEGMINAASNIATLLKTSGAEAGLCFVLPECNSMGLGMMQAPSIQKAISRLQRTNATVVIIENDLYRHLPPKETELFFKNCRSLILLDNHFNHTSENAQVLIPVASFAEADGTIVNYEGRAQRYFQVYMPSNPYIMETWKWLKKIQMLRLQISNGHGHHPDKMLQELETSMPIFNGISGVAPLHSFSIHGEKIPREPHRYSGRTAMLAKINVSEPKPAVDEDSPLSFTMEGYRGIPPPPLIPFFWAPGWNSVQSVNKYQVEPGGALKGGDPGTRLFSINKNSSSVFFKEVPEAFKQPGGRWLVLPMFHVLGSGELSSYSTVLQELSPAPYAVLSTNDATRLNVIDEDRIQLTVGDDQYVFNVKISGELKDGIIMVSKGLRDSEAIAWNSWVKIETLNRTT